MTGLDAAQRAALERLIVQARSMLERDLESQAEGRYGINSDGTIDDEAALHLDPSALADRRELVDVVAHLRNEGESEEGAVARLIREAAFTHLNRLVAIRIAEAIGLAAAIACRRQGLQGFRDVLELAPSLAGDETGGYWTYLRLCGDELAGDAPALFDPRNPLLTLAPSPQALDELVDVLSDPAAQETGRLRMPWVDLPVLQHWRRAPPDARRVRSSRELARARGPQPVLHSSLRRRLPGP